MSTKTGQCQPGRPYPNEFLAVRKTNGGVSVGVVHLSRSGNCEVQGGRFIRGNIWSSSTNGRIRGNNLIFETAYHRITINNNGSAAEDATLKNGDPGFDGVASRAQVLNGIAAVAIGGPPANRRQTTPSVDSRPNENSCQSKLAVANNRLRELNVRGPISELRPTLNLIDRLNRSIRGGATICNSVGDPQAQVGQSGGPVGTATIVEPSSGESSTSGPANY